ncbi:hypothetical protein BSKO_08935 [Bryopsis sp. KO-2023]|nr:hypothetical protein BSKO_08935 [Bryopsis sp. KO-2023]
MFHARKSGGGRNRPSTPRSGTSNTSLKSIHLEDTANRNSSIGPKDNTGPGDSRSAGGRKSESKAVIKRFLRDDENCDPNPPAKRPRISEPPPKLSGFAGPSRNRSGQNQSSKKATLAHADAQSFFNMISNLKAQEKELPPRYTIEECADLGDQDLRKMHRDWEKEEPDATSINTLKNSFEAGPSTLYGAILRLEAHPIGYIFFSKRATALGTVSTDPPSKLVHLYINPAHRKQGHGSRMIHWFMKNHVKAVRHFSVLQPNFPMRMLLKKTEYKEIPSGSGDGSKKDYIACMD